MTIYYRPITFTPAIAPQQTRYLPANAISRPITTPAPTPAITGDPTRPGGLSQGAGSTPDGGLTREEIAARARVTVSKYPSAHFQDYTVMGGYWYGVSTADGQTLYTKLNPATAETYPDPRYEYLNRGAGQPGPVSPGTPKPVPPGPGATKSQISAYSEALASWEREQLWRSLPDWASWSDISWWYNEGYIQSVPQEIRQWQIKQSLLPQFPSPKFLSLEQQYKSQHQVIVSSSGNLVPVFGESGKVVDYRNVSTGELFHAPPQVSPGALFSAPAVLDHGGKAAEVAGIGAARLGRSVMDRGLIGGIAYAYLGKDYLSGGGILPAAILKPVGPPGSGIDLSPAVQGVTGFFKATPVLSQAYGAGSMIREEGGVLEAYEKWNKETAVPFVQQYVPMPTSETIESTKKAMSFLLPVISPALAPAQYSSQAISGISQTFTGSKTPLVSDLLTEYVVGEIEGIRTRPVEAVGMFALTFALPAISEAGAWGWKASPTLMRLSQGKYTKYVFGKIPAMSAPETVQGLKLKTLTGMAAGGQRMFNPTVIAIESVMGIMWGQSVVERITAGPDQTITTKTTTPGSTTARSWIEGGGVRTETTTVGPSVTETTKVVPGEAAIPARLTFDGNRLVWGVDTSKLPPTEKMARTAGEITSVEVLPAIGGMIAGQKVIPKISGWLRSGDTPIDILTIGYPAAEGYPISGKITGKSLQYSFEKNTFAPYPERMQSGFTKEVTHVPRSARLPTEPPGLRGGWSGMEQDIGKVGATFTLQRNPSEMAGLYMAPGAEFYFTKVEGQGLADIQLIAGLPTVPQPTMLRITGITDFVEVPRSVRARTLNLIKSWRRAHPNQKMPLSAKQEAYKVVNFWAQENVEPGQAVLPLLKAEYEAVVPTFTKGGQTQLKVSGRKYYVTDEGVRVPIVEAMITEPHKDFAPGGVPITDVHTGKIIERQVGPIGEARRIAAEEVPRTFRQLGGPEGKGPGVDGILARMQIEDRAATEQLFKVAKGVEGMKAPIEGALDISKVQSIDAKDAAAIENLLAKYGAEVYGSTIRLGQMEHGRIMQKYGKMPGDLEVKVKDFVGLSRDVAKAIGGTTKKNPFGISVYKGGKEVMSANALRGTMPENPFGWNPTEYVQVKSGAGQYAYERLNQQVIRYAYGSLAGREVRGQWKWGPKPHRTEKDIVGFYSDVQYLLESQPSRGGQVEQVATAMREIRKHPLVSEVLKGRKFQYGPGSKDYFAGVPLDQYIYDVRTGKRGLITEVGIGASALNLLKAPSTRTTTTGGEVSVITTTTGGEVSVIVTAPQAYVSVAPSFAMSYVFLGDAGRRMITSTRRQTETTPVPSYSRAISETSGITGGVSVFSGTSYGSSISKLISGRSGITGFTGGSLVSGRSGITGITGGSGRSGVSGRSGISGVSGRSGISGRSGVSGYSGYYSGYYGGYTPGSPPPNVPPRVPPSTTPMLLTWTHRRWRFILEEKQKKKLRLHFDVRGSKWIIKSPIPRPEVVLGGEPGKQYRNELKIYGKQYSKGTYTVHAPFDVISDYKVTKGMRF